LPGSQGDLLPDGLGIAEGVEIAAMVLDMKQEDVVVLAIDVGDGSPGVLQRADRDEDPIDVSFPRPLDGDLSLDEDLVALIGAQDGERPRRDLEQGFDGSFCGPRPDIIGGAFLSEEEADGVDEDGFPGSGLSGQDREPVGELEGQVLDGGEVPDPQELDHAARYFEDVNR